MVKRIYSRRRYLGTKREPRKCRGVGQRIEE